MRPVVSVVIPAHNPGRYIEPCIRSLLRQTMSRQRFEVIFVDDGSTDGTGERLDRLAREQAHIRVIHIPASGAPGRPRNVGLEAALGEYVQFLDADDELAPRALKRLLRMARANGSDIVLGKFASETLSRRQDLFTRNRGATTLAETPPLADASMGPTKLFRTEFLREHEISFPEGWRQMEDQLFTLRAYLAAQVISILGDEPCYFFNKREDEGHISAEVVDPALHAAHLAEILDEVEAGTPNEALRRRLTARFYRLEVLGRLTGSRYLSAPAEYQRELFSALRNLTRQRIGEGVQDGLGAFARVRSRLLIEGDLAGLLSLGERVAGFAVNARVRRAAWANGRLGIEFRATLVRGEGTRPLTLVERDQRVLLDPAVADDLVGPVDVTEELAGIRAQVSLIDRETALEWIVPCDAGLVLRPAGDAGDPDDEARTPGLGGFVELDPQRVGPGERPLDDGAWDIQLRWSGLGMQATGLLRLPQGALSPEGPPIEPALVGRPIRWVVPRSDPDGALRIGIGGADRLPARIDDGARRLLRQGAGIGIELPIATDRRGTLATGTLRLAGEPGIFDLPADFEGELGLLAIWAKGGPDRDMIPRGRYALTAHLGDGTAPGLPVGAVVVRDDGDFVVLGLRRTSQLARLRSTADWAARTFGEATRAGTISTFRRLPSWAKDPVRSLFGRLRG